MERSDLAEQLADFLRHGDFVDASWNGIQVEGSESVERIATAVDPTLPAIRGAAESGATFLIVHHGLFWGKGQPIVGPLREKIGALLEHDLTLFASHLPLDAHPEVGNNARLAAVLDLPTTDRFATIDGESIGVVCRPDGGIDREDLAVRLTEATGQLARLQSLGPDRVERIGIVSGNGSSFVGEATELGLDCLITGEWTYTNYQLARDHGLNVIAGGHYATETLGVEALGSHLEERFDLGHTFVADPAPL